MEIDFVPLRRVKVRVSERRSPDKECEVDRERSDMECSADWLSVHELIALLKERETVIEADADRCVRLDPSARREYDFEFVAEAVALLGEADLAPVAVAESENVNVAVSVLQR